MAFGDMFKNKLGEAAQLPEKTFETATVPPRATTGELKKAKARKQPSPNATRDEGAGDE